MYKSYPSAGQESGVQRPAPPQSVRALAKIMYCGAALNLLGIILIVATISRLRSAIVAKYPQYSSGQIHRLEITSVGSVIVIGLVAIILWIWLARASLAGKSWVRPTGTVLFVINTLALLSVFTRPHSVFDLISGLLVWLIGLAAVILLWGKESSNYFRAAE
jgi:hypothetical protein